MEIVTKRFLLRDFVESDRSAFLDYQADPRNLAFYSPNESSPDHALRLFELFQAWAGDCPRLNYQLAIVQRQEPYALVGCCGLRGMSFAAGEMELGLELAPLHQDGRSSPKKLLMTGESVHSLGDIPLLSLWTKREI